MTQLRWLTIVSFCLLVYSSMAQEAELCPMPKFSGYMIGKTVTTIGGETSTSDGFSLRIARMMAEGSVLRPWIKYKFQADLRGIPERSIDPRMLEAWLEWSRYDWLRVRLGEQKRLMGMEAFTHPFLIGSGDYTMLTKKLLGLGDRSGERLCGGYDLGLTVQGDIHGPGRHTLHYQIGCYNGEGNLSEDTNHEKDWMGGLYYTPNGRLTVGVYGWEGSVGAGAERVGRNRYSLGVKYESDWTFRAEYAHSVGGVYGKPEAGERSSGWYATVGRTLNPWLSLFSRFDTYRDDDTRQSRISNLTFTANLQLHRNLLFLVEYLHSDTHGQAVSHQIWAEAMFRF